VGKTFLVDEALRNDIPITTRGRLNDESSGDTIKQAKATLRARSGCERSANEDDGRMKEHALFHQKNDKYASIFIFFG